LLTDEVEFFEFFELSELDAFAESEVFLSSSTCLLLLRLCF